MSEHKVQVEGDPVAVLRVAVDCAVQAVLRLDPRHVDARQEINRVLAGYAATVAPVLDHLRDLADRTPNGPVSAALGFLDDAGDQAASGDVQAARVFLLAGRAALFRLARAGPAGG
ncbi:hypothetical protein ACIQMJ_22435 [Actinosynnema sp. NPDC091369]